MSMIYGFINLDGRPADPAILKNMESALADKKHDAQSALVAANVAMGFKNQYITEESHFEAVPYHDAETGLYFVCDAIIDNREELAALLGLRLTKETPDGRFIFEAYKKWGERCTDHLLGDFAFVVYDSRNRRAQLFRDHMGKRILYYRFENHCIYFSTLIKPLIDPWGNGEKPKLNEEYLVYFLAVKDIRHEIIAGSTIYHEISYIIPAGCLTVTEKCVSNSIYWKPSEIKTERSLKKTDYVEEFKDILRNAVRCRLRVDGEIGVLLSGGLDSSAVACITASILREQNRQLHTYTSVPLRGFMDWAPRHVISDESGAVNIMQAAYPNMITHFVDSKGKNPLNVANRMMDVFEQPYKFIDNSYWLDDIVQRASEDGCKILLSGRTGNSTVSFGRADIIFFEHIMGLRWLRLIRDFNAFCRYRKLGRKGTAVILAADFFNSIFRTEKSRSVSEHVNAEYLKKYDVEKKLCVSGLAGKPSLRVNEIKRQSFHPTLINQNNSAGSKMCIDVNICDRDPTDDKRIVEFCLRLPYECYFDKKTGQDRALIRQAMTGVVPEEVLKNMKYGQQAVDWIERIKPHWNDYLDNFREELGKGISISGYLDLHHIEDVIKANSELSYSYDTINNVRNIIIIDNCKKFVDML